jgi:putative endonuclease
VRRERTTVEAGAEAEQPAVARLRPEPKKTLPLKNSSRPNNSPRAKAGEAVWFVYLLRCADGTLYTGISNDLARRCTQHNAGTAARYTRSRRPVVLVYQEIQASRSAALKRELAIKRLTRPAKEALLRLAG